MLDVTEKHLGAQSNSLDSPGYWAPVRQQSWVIECISKEVS